MPLEIKDLAFVGYPVTDIPRARAFYEKVLGLRATMEHQFEGGQWWVEYDIGSGTIAISDAWPPSGQSGPGAALEVTNLDDALQQCRTEKVTVCGDVIDTPVCRFFGIKDPDGNDISIHQSKK